MPYDLPSHEIHSRIVKTPDGIDHLIAMAGWYWNCLDWMDAEKGWTKDDFVGMAWRIANRTQANCQMKNPGNFRAEFADAFKASIGYQAKLFIKEADGVANDLYGEGKYSGV